MPSYECFNTSSASAVNILFQYLPLVGALLGSVLPL
jgi:hypothetical protein